jgi:hypothetical protein
MTWTEGVLHISENFEIHGGYLGIIGCSIYAIAIIWFLIFVCSVGAMIGDTIKELNEKSKR